MRTITCTRPPPPPPTPPPHTPALRHLPALAKAHPEEGAAALQQLAQPVVELPEPPGRVAAYLLWAAARMSRGARDPGVAELMDCAARGVSTMTSNDVATSFWALSILGASKPELEQLLATK